MTLGLWPAEVQADQKVSLLSVRIKCNVEELFKAMWISSDFASQLHKLRNDTNLVETPWYASRDQLPQAQYTWDPPAGAKGETAGTGKWRKVRFESPPAAMASKPFNNEEVQLCVERHPDRHLVDLKANTTAPYGDKFDIYLRTAAYAESPSSSLVHVTFATHWSPSMNRMLKGMIGKAIEGGIRGTYKTWRQVISGTYSVEDVPESAVLALAASLGAPEEAVAPAAPTAAAAPAAVAAVPAKGVPEGGVQPHREASRPEGPLAYAFGQLVWGEQVSVLSDVVGAGMRSAASEGVVARVLAAVVTLSIIHTLVTILHSVQMFCSGSRSLLWFLCLPITHFVDLPDSLAEVIVSLLMVAAVNYTIIWAGNRSLDFVKPERAAAMAGAPAAAIAAAAPDTSAATPATPVPEEPQAPPALAASGTATPNLTGAAVAAAAGATVPVSTKQGGKPAPAPHVSKAGPKRADIIPPKGRPAGTVAAGPAASLPSTSHSRSSNSLASNSMLASVIPPSPASFSVATAAPLSQLSAASSTTAPASQRISGTGAASRTSATTTAPLPMQMELSTLAVSSGSSISTAAQDKAANSKTDQKSQPASKAGSGSSVVDSKAATDHGASVNGSVNGSAVEGAKEGTGGSTTATSSSNGASGGMAKSPSALKVSGGDSSAVNSPSGPPSKDNKDKPAASPRANSTTAASASAPTPAPAAADSASNPGSPAGPRSPPSSTAATHSDATTTAATNTLSVAPSLALPDIIITESPRPPSSNGKSPAAVTARQAGAPTQSHSGVSGAGGAVVSTNPHVFGAQYPPGAVPPQYAQSGSEPMKAWIKSMSDSLDMLSEGFKGALGIKQNVADGSESLMLGVGLEHGGPDTVEEEVFENERFQPFRGWGHMWPGHFLPSDRVGHWSDAAGGPGGTASMIFEQVEPVLAPGWSWLEEDWQLDMEGLEREAVDEQGWTYALDFNYLKHPPPAGCGKCTLKHFVRRRRWFRTRVRNATVMPVPVAEMDRGHSADTSTPGSPNLSLLPSITSPTTSANTAGAAPLPAVKTHATAAGKPGSPSTAAAIAAATSTSILRRSGAGTTSTNGAGTTGTPQAAQSSGAAKQGFELRDLSGSGAGQTSPRLLHRTSSEMIPAPGSKAGTGAGRAAGADVSPPRAQSADPDIAGSSLAPSSLQASALSRSAPQPATANGLSSSPGGSGEVHVAARGDAGDAAGARLQASGSGGDGGGVARSPRNLKAMSGPSEEGSEADTFSDRWDVDDLSLTSSSLVSALAAAKGGGHHHGRHARMRQLGAKLDAPTTGPDGVAGSARTTAGSGGGGAAPGGGGQHRRVVGGSDALSSQASVDSVSSRSSSLLHPLKPGASFGHP